MTLLTVEHPDWMLDAECTRADPNVFYPEPAGRSVNEAKAVCACCAVTAECLAFALAHGELHFGVWGGRSAKERQQLVGPIGRGRRRIPKPIEHGTTNGYRTHLRRNEQACRVCLDAEAAAQRRSRRPRNTSTANAPRSPRP